MHLLVPRVRDKRGQSLVRGAPQQRDRPTVELERATARRPRLDCLAGLPSLPDPVHRLCQRLPLDVTLEACSEPSSCLPDVVVPCRAIELPAAASEVLGESLCLLAQLLGPPQFLEQRAAGSARHQVGGYA
jgi:hypothetical protein